MATERTTSARDFLLADNARPSLVPRLSDWLVQDLKARPSSVPPPPAPALESHVEVTAPAPEAEAVVAPAPEALATRPADTGDVHADAPEEAAESDDLAASLSYAREGEEEPVDPSTSAETTAVAAASTAAAGAVVYASAEDWLDDDRPFETTSSFTPPPVGVETNGAVTDDFMDRATGASLSPQVLEAGDEESEDAAGAYVVPGAGSGRGWKTAAGVVAALLLLFLVIHRMRAPRATATAARPVAAPALEAPPAPARDDAPKGESIESLPKEPADTAMSSLGGVGRGHGESSDTSSSDPSVPGGPSVARFPDLPREVLMQLEQVAESEEGKHASKATPTDSVERFTR